MAYFDFLIDKDQQEPKVGMEYIYRLDMVWTPGKMESKQIKVGTIMTNVEHLDNGYFKFINKETGEQLRCNYGWALAENTPENIEKIKIYEKEFIKFEEAERNIEALRNNIVTLKSKE